jgi:IS605 OrfB family transposase
VGNKKTYTYQTRIAPDKNATEFLHDFSKLYGTVERKLFADYAKNIDIKKQKSSYLVKYGITARQFNSVRIMLQGKIDSIRSRINDYIEDTEAKIKKTSKSIKSLIKKISGLTSIQKNKLHQKKRLLSKQQNKLQDLKADKESDKVRICFGSKKLFNKQFNLEDNNYDNHEEWQEDWDIARNNQFYLIGSKDETMGNQSCVATLEEDSINLRIRVPDELISKYGKFITLTDINFEYGQDTILEAMVNNIRRNQLQKKSCKQLHGDLFKEYGQAVNYRFLYDKKGWRLFITVDKTVAKFNTNKLLGSTGVDINETHIAITEIDSKGNLLKSFNVQTNTYGKSKEQAKAIIGDAVKSIVNYATIKNKPIVIENLDFKQKKRELGNNVKKNRKLSSLAYSMIIEMLKSKAFRCGVEVHQVNPAYSSVIGRVKFASIYKISVHAAAAMVIARRLFSFSERLPQCWDNVPDNTGGRVTLPELVKIHGRHVWHSWAKVRKSIQAVLVAQYQMRTKLAGQVQLPEDDYIPF